MELREFLVHVNSGRLIKGGSEAHRFMHGAAQEALQTIAEPWVRRTPVGDRHRVRQAHAMRAAWYDEQGPSRDVLKVGDLPTPQPAAGEVRVRVRYSGINPGDTKKRRGWQGSTMPYPRVIPHSD